MRFTAFKSGNQEGLAIAVPNGEFHGMSGKKEG
jgi:hypothetical protein